MTEELKPCPFCGVSMRLLGNRNFHRLVGDHAASCMFDAEDAAGMVPATEEQRRALIDDWNRRAAPSQPDPWHDAVLRECMAIEGAYVEADPTKTLRALIDWHVMCERDPAPSQPEGAKAPYTWNYRACPCGSQMGSECLEAGDCKWMADPSLVPQDLRIPRSAGAAAPDEGEKMSMLATFVHEVLIGAMSESETLAEADKVLRCVGLRSLNDVVALSAPKGEEGKP